MRLTGFFTIRGYWGMFTLSFYLQNLSFGGIKNVKSEMSSRSCLGCFKPNMNIDNVYEFSTVKIIIYYFISGEL